jgi:hypothetical protein
MYTSLTYKFFKLLRFSTMNKGVFILLFLVAFVFFYYNNASAALLITWTGGGTEVTCGAGNENKWSCAANWSTNTVPGVDDQVTFDGTGVKDVVIDGSGTLSIRRLTITSAYTGSITVDGINVLRLHAKGGSGQGSLSVAEGANIDFGGIPIEFYSTTLDVVPNISCTPEAPATILDLNSYMNVSDFFVDFSVATANARLTVNQNCQLIVATRNTNRGGIEVNNGAVVYLYGDRGLMNEQQSKTIYLGFIQNRGHLVAGGEIINYNRTTSGSRQTQFENGSLTDFSNLVEISASGNFHSGAFVIQNGATLDISNLISIDIRRGLTIGSSASITWNEDAMTTFLIRNNQDNVSQTITINKELVANLHINTNSSGATVKFVSTNSTIEIKGSFLAGEGRVLVANSDTEIRMNVHQNLVINSGSNAFGNSSFGGDNLIMSMVGTEDSVFNVRTSNLTINSPIEMNKSGGAVVSQLTTTGATWSTSNTCTIKGETHYKTNGKNNNCTGGLTVSGDAHFEAYGGETMTSFTRTGNATIELTGDGDAGDDSYTISNFGTTFKDLIINSTDGATDIFSLGQNLTIGGDLRILAGTVDAGSGTPRNIDLAGDWIQGTGSVFVPRTGLVELTGENQSIFGNVTFYRLKKIVQGENPQTLTFENGKTVTVENQLTLEGVDAGARLLLRSAAEGVEQWNINPTGASVTVAALDVQDSNNNAEDPISCSENCVNSGNNTNWAFTAPDVSVNPTALFVSENGDEDSFTVVLTTAPTHNVTFSVASNNLAEGTVDKDSITFTPDNWNEPQMITVTGVDDDIVDGNVVFSIILGVITSDDPAYGGLNPGDVTVTNIDNDTASIVISDISGNTTTEAGGQVTFKVALSAQPTANVTVPVLSTDTTEGTVSPALLLFTPLNWSTSQTVTVTGVNDFLIDGDIEYSIIFGVLVSDDDAFNDVEPDDEITLTNTDDDTAQLVLGTVNGNTSESGGIATFTVRLSAQPTASVIVSFVSEDTTEVVISPATPSLTFTSANWNTNQTVVLVGVDDFLLDGPQEVAISIGPTTSDDVNFNGLTGSRTVINTDNEKIAFVSPLSITTTEAGGSEDITVVLNFQPSDTVTISVASSNTAEGIVSTNQLIFTNENWNIPQVITVTGVDDLVADGNKVYTITLGNAVSSDPLFNGQSVDNVSATNQDNDVIGATIVGPALAQTSENGDIATFTIALNSQPTGTVTVTIASTDTTEGTVAPTSIQFTTGNWNIPRQITVAGQDDAIIDGDIEYDITFTFSGGGYGLYELDPITFVNLDNDDAGIVVAPLLLTIEEGGDADSFTVVLEVEPADDVIVLVQSANTNIATVDVAELVFTPLNWSVPQAVAVSGVQNDYVDGVRQVAIILTVDEASEQGYVDLPLPEVSVTVTDDDEVSVIFSTTEISVTEGGATDNFSVRLGARPSSNVLLFIQVGDADQIEVDQDSILFTTDNWDTPQIITVTAIDDVDVEGPLSTDITFAPLESLDLAFDGFVVNDVIEVEVIDNDEVGVTVTSLVGAVSESGAFATFTVVLQAEPTANVVFTVDLDDPLEAVAIPDTLTFTPENWFTPQMVRLEAIDDDVKDGNTANGVTISIASGDIRYHAYTRPEFEFAFTVIDDETAQLIVSETSGNTVVSNRGITVDTYVLQLSSIPEADVYIDLYFDDEAIEVQPSQLIFNQFNWNVPQIVTVSYREGFVPIDNEMQTLITHTVASGDQNYNQLQDFDIVVNISFIETGRRRRLLLKEKEPMSVEIITSDNDGILRVGQNIIFELLINNPLRFIDIFSIHINGIEFIERKNTLDNFIEFTVPEVAVGSTISVGLRLNDLVTDVESVYYNFIVDSTTEYTDIVHDFYIDQRFIINRVDSLPYGIKVGDLVKRRDLPDVYIIDEYGYRRPFFNERVFTSYQLSFSDIRIISEKELSAIVLGRPVHLSSNYLLNFMGESKIFKIISRNSPITPSKFTPFILPLNNESHAELEIGKDWKERIISLPITFYGQYQR